MPAYYLAITAVVLWAPKALYDARKRMSPLEWSNVECELEGAELERLREFVYKQRDFYASKYDFTLTVDRAYKVCNPDLEERHDAFTSNLVAGGKSSYKEQLFHGTSTSSVMSITHSGFRLPERAGMFGKGIYFANTPLKSLQYTSWWRRKKGVMLVCDVELGNTKYQRSADPTTAPDSHLKRHWFMAAIGKRSFDSVTAADGLLGSVRVPEYIVFKPDQTVPRYVLFVTEVQKIVRGWDGKVQKG